MNKGKQKKLLLLSYDDFGALIEQNGYFVDKSLFIKELIDIPHQVILITRPRRFGKSLNLSMLKYFWELPNCRVNDTGQDRDMSHLFRDLAIWKQGEKYIEQQGKFPVIFFSFRGAKQDTWEETENEIKDEIAREFERHSYLLEGEFLKGKAREVFERIKNQEGELKEYTSGIVTLTKHLSRYFGRNPIVLIDEYDTPIQKGYLKNYYAPVINFFKTFLVKGLKSNSFLGRAILTGIMRVAQESIFSDFNNPSVSTITSKAYADKFGFTEGEVKEILEYFGFGESFPGVKEWYNGYIFGKTHDIYNPWSILRFIEEEADQFRPYWLNTSENRIIREVLQLNKKKSKETLEALLAGQAVIEEVTENVVYNEIRQTPEAALNFLLQSGYLKADNPELQDDMIKYSLTVPNKEIRTVYKKMLKQWFRQDQPIAPDLEEITQALKESDWPLFEEALSRILLKTVSYYDLNPIRKDMLPEEKEKAAKENFYHGLMLGLMVHLTVGYQVVSNREFGEGRPDMVILPEDKGQRAFVFEFKYLKSSEKGEPKEAAANAMAQIKEMKYIEGVKAAGYGQVTAIGIGFKGKEVKVEYGGEDEG